MNKTILLATFIFPERVDWFLNYLGTKFSITKDKVFCYKNLDDESKYIITFKLTVQKDKPLISKINHQEKLTVLRFLTLTFMSLFGNLIW